MEKFRCKPPQIKIEHMKTFLKSYRRPFFMGGNFQPPTREVPAGLEHLIFLQRCYWSATNAQTPVLVFFTAGGGAARANLQRPASDLSMDPTRHPGAARRPARGGGHRRAIRACPATRRRSRVRHLNLTPAGDTVAGHHRVPTARTILLQLAHQQRRRGAFRHGQRQNRARADLIEADQLLAAKDEDSVRKGAAKIFDLCAAREAGFLAESG